MSIELLLKSLLLISILTSLTTEAIKKLLEDKNKSDNIIALICSVVISTFICVSNIIINNLELTGELGISCISLIFLSFLVSTLGYDKVMQTLRQLGVK